MAVEVIVPATSANLGPGYDTFGLALGLYNRFTAEPANTWSVEVHGEGAGVLRTDAGNRVAVAMARVFEACGQAGRAAAITCRNDVPAGRGMGSSSAAIVGGMLLANALCDDVLDPRRILDLAVEMEGHPDNVAAALRGGFTISWRGADGYRAERFDPPCGVAAVLVIPDTELLTTASRELLPSAVPHADAAFNVSRAALLAAGFVSGRAELFAEAFDDRLHEPYRRAAVPGYDRMRDALGAAGVDGIALSGAGPTVIGVVCAADDTAALMRAEDAVDRMRPDAFGLGGRSVAVPIDRLGARVV